MIYLNNAATTYPKPECVMQAVQACLSDMPVSQFRTGTELRKGDPASLCRQKIGELLQIKEYDRICFTSGATESLNQLIAGLNYQNKQIYTTQIEHNSTLRPLINQKETRNHPLIIIPCDKNGEISPEMLETYLEKPGFLFINHCSNVTGRIQELAEITKICHAHQVLVFADLSQSAGCIPVRVDEWDLDGIVFTGHKGLMGIRGTGGFWCKPDLSLYPLKFGGTGRNSAQLRYEDDWEYEVGTQNDPGIAALLAGVSCILEKRWK